MSTAEEWADGVISRGRKAGDLPIYGSAEWQELPDDDTRKVASIVRAAEAWRREGEPDAVALQLQRDVAEADWMLRMRMAEASHDVSRSWQAPTGPTHQELQQRRADLLQVRVDENRARGWER